MAEAWKRRALEFCFPVRFAISSSYRNVRESQIYVCAWLLDLQRDCHCAVLTSDEFCGQTLLFFWGFESTQLARKEKKECERVCMCMCVYVCVCAHTHAHTHTHIHTHTYTYTYTHIHTHTAHRWRCSNKEARKRLARRHSRNGARTHEWCFKVDVFVSFKNRKSALSTLDRFRSGRKDEAGRGGLNMKQSRKNSLANCIPWINIVSNNMMRSVLCSHNFSLISYNCTHSTQVTAPGLSCKEPNWNHCDKF